MGAKVDSAHSTGTDIIKRRLDRRYQRLCRLSNDLGRLDFSKAAIGGPAAPGGPSNTAVEDFIFSQVDFSRYREMSEKDFDPLFPEGLTDFSDGFLRNNFGFGRTEIQSVIEKSYEKTGRYYRIKKESYLVLSIMRFLDTSIGDSSLVTSAEIKEELKSLPSYTAGDIDMSDLVSIYQFLVLSLDNVSINHKDGMATRLFISPQGDLSGTFRPGGKPWTRVLIPLAEIAF